MMTATSRQQYERQQLTNHLNGGEAFTPLSGLLEQIPFEKLGVVPEGLPYSIWQQFYHIRFAQYDILEFSRNAGYQAPQWPDDYWPKNVAPKNESVWKELVALYHQERKEFMHLLQDSSIDLFQPFPHGSGQTLFREALLVIEHTAYHTGQLLIMMRQLGIYPQK